MPPEVVQHGTLSKATDVWSFGMIVLEMVTGQRAYMGLHYGQIIRQVGEGALLLRARVACAAPAA